MDPSMKCDFNVYFITRQPLRAVGVLFSPIVSGWVGGGKKAVSFVVSCRKLILGRDIG